MKSLLALAALTIPALAGAQSLSNPQPSMNMPNYSTEASMVFGRDTLPPRRETAAAKQIKLTRALALREEALMLQQQDGGRLSRISKAHLQRKARAILAYR